MDCTRFFKLLLLFVAVACGTSLAAEEPQTAPPCNMICTFIYDPVCGSDGLTYSNECVFHSLTCVNGIDATVAHKGPC